MREKNEKFGLNDIRKFIVRYRAIFFIIGLGTASVLGVIHLFNISNTQNVQVITQSSIDTAKKAFADLEKNMENTLSATLEVLAPNETFAAAFVSGDRERLYQLTNPLYKTLRVQNHITHFLFITPEPDQRVFLRFQKPDLFNDRVDRVTLSNCIKTKKVSFGQELGQTALVLRAVHPYYYKNRLVGYLELGIQIEDFLEVLKNQTGNEFGLFLKKLFVDREQWEAVMSRKPARNTWDDMNHLLLVYATSSFIQLSRYQSRLENLETIPDEGIILEQISKEDTHFIRGIFPFYDAGGRKAGGVFFLKDISNIFGAMQKQKQRIVLMILGFMGIMIFIMIFFHKRAETELRKYRYQLEEMVEENTALMSIILLFLCFFSSRARMAFTTRFTMICSK